MDKFLNIYNFIFSYFDYKNTCDAVILIKLECTSK